MSYYSYQDGDMSYYKPKVPDMLSYIVVQGVPREDTCSVFGLTHKEVRYLRVRTFFRSNLIAYKPNLKTKFNTSRRPSKTSPVPPPNPMHGISIPASTVVVINALGFIGFKVVSSSGDIKVIQTLVHSFCFCCCCFSNLRQFVLVICYHALCSKITWFGFLFVQFLQNSVSNKYFSNELR